MVKTAISSRVSPRTARLGLLAGVMCLVGILTAWASVGITLAGLDDRPVGVVGWLLLPVGLVLMYGAVGALAVFQRRILRQYRISPRETPKLKLADLSSVPRFDAWLAAHGRRPPVDSDTP